MPYAIELTREQKREVIALARQLGMSATALYREYATAAPTRTRRTVREDAELANIYTVKAQYRAVSREITDACRAKLTAARGTNGHALATRILAAFPGKGIVVTNVIDADDNETVEVYAVTDRRGTVEQVATVTVEADRTRAYPVKWSGGAGQVLMEDALLDALAPLLPARIDTTPSRFVSRLKPAKTKRSSDRTGEAATGRVSKQGKRDVDPAHMREMHAARNRAYRAKKKAAKQAALGAILPPKPELITDTAPVYKVPAPPAGKTHAEQQREADAVRTAREAAKAAEAAAAAEAEAEATAEAEAEATADAEAEAAAMAEAMAEAMAAGKRKRAAAEAATDAALAADEKWSADMRAAHPELFPTEPDNGMLF